MATKPPPTSDPSLSILEGLLLSSAMYSLQALVHGNVNYGTAKEKGREHQFLYGNGIL